MLVKKLNKNIRMKVFLPSSFFELQVVIVEPYK